MLTAQALYLCSEYLADKITGLARQQGQPPQRLELVSWDNGFHLAHNASQLTNHVRIVEGVSTASKLSLGRMLYSGGAFLWEEAHNTAKIEQLCELPAGSLKNWGEELPRRGFGAQRLSVDCLSVKMGGAKVSLITFPGERHTLGRALSLSVEVGEVYDATRACQAITHKRAVGEQLGLKKNDLARFYTLVEAYYYFNHPNVFTNLSDRRAQTLQTEVQIHEQLH